jgi:hypothetical protein
VSVPGGALSILALSKKEYPGGPEEAPLPTSFDNFFYIHLGTFFLFPATVRKSGSRQQIMIFTDFGFE